MGALTLFVTADDVAGSLNALARDLRTRKEDARVLSLSPDPDLEFPVDLHQSVDGGRELLSVAGQTTHLHLVDLCFDHLGPWASPLKAKIEVGQVTLSLQFDGAISASMIRQELRAWGSRPRSCIATRPELAKKLQIDFLPPYLPISRAGYRPLRPGTRSREQKNKRARFYFAARRPMTHYPAVEALIDRWDAHDNRDVEVQIGKRHADVLARRRRTQITACGAKNYLSRSGLEALAAGLRVVSPNLGDWQEAYAALADGQAPPLMDAQHFEQHYQEILASTESDLQARAWAVKVLDPRRWWQHFGSYQGQASKVA